MAKPHNLMYIMNGVVHGLGGGKIFLEGEG